MGATFWASVAANAFIDCGLAISVGGLFALRWTAANTDIATYEPRVRAVLQWASTVVLIGLLVHTYSYAATMLDSGRLMTVARGLPSIAGTHTGLVDIVASMAAALMIVAALLSRGVAKATALLAVPLLTVVTCRSMTGHAANQGSFTISELVQFIHLAATFVWSGSVSVAGLWLRPAIIMSYSSRDRSLLHSLSAASICALPVVLLTGALKSYQGTDGHLVLILHSGWGWILMVKIGAVAAALVLGAMHFRAIRSNAPGDQSPSPAWLKRTMTIEAVLLLMVLALSALLATSVPPSE